MFTIVSKKQNLSLFQEVTTQALIKKRNGNMEKKAGYLPDPSKDKWYIVTKDFMAASLKKRLMTKKLIL